jgi:hypothetical protein
MFNKTTINSLQRNAGELARKTRKGHHQLSLSQTEIPMVIEHLSALPRNAPCPYVLRILPLEFENKPYEEWPDGLRRDFTTFFELFVRDLEHGLTFKTCPWRIKWWSLDNPRNKGPAWLVAFRHADVIRELKYCFNTFLSDGVVKPVPTYTQAYFYSFPRKGENSSGERWLRRYRSKFVRFQTR